jgi:hypothetical protein
MLKMSQRDGAVWYCDICQSPVLEVSQALGLWRPLNGPQDRTDVLIVHTRCQDAPLTRMLLPKSNKATLRLVFSQADEAINRG